VWEGRTSGRSSNLSDVLCMVLSLCCLCCADFVLLVDGIQVHKVEAVSQSKSNGVWIYNTVCTRYTWSR
jgi:hypothetical protein